MNPTQAELVLHSVRLGVPFARAVTNAGVSVASAKVIVESGRRLFMELCEGGVDPEVQVSFLVGANDKRDLDFYTRYEKARHDVIVRNVANIQMHAQGYELDQERVTTEKGEDGKQVTVKTKVKVMVKGDWKASAWLLEQLAPTDYGKRLAVQDDTTDGVVGFVIKVIAGGENGGNSDQPETSRP